MTFHNPNDLTDEQVVVSRGWRLITDEELRNPPYPADLQWWSSSSRWNAVSNPTTRLSAVSADLCYRTKASLPDPLFVGLSQPQPVVRNSVEQFKAWVHRASGAVEWGTRCMSNTERLGFTNCLDNPACGFLYAALYHMYDGGTIIPDNIRALFNDIINALSDWTGSNIPRAQAVNQHQELCNILYTLSASAE